MQMTIEDWGDLTSSGEITAGDWAIYQKTGQKVNFTQLLYVIVSLHHKVQTVVLKNLPVSMATRLSTYSSWISLSKALNSEISPVEALIRKISVSPSLMKYLNQNKQWLQLKTVKLTGLPD